MPKKLKNTGRCEAARISFTPLKKVPSPAEADNGTTVQGQLTGK